MTAILTTGPARRPPTFRAAPDRPPPAPRSPGRPRSLVVQRPPGGSLRRHLAPVLVALALALPLAPVATAAPAGTSLAISVLSNRADLVSGGDALVAVELPAGVVPSKVRVLLGDQDVTPQFALRPDGRFEGLLTGLVVGDNVVRVKA